MATINPAELATALGTDARTTRKFLRSITPREAQPGKGSRWAIEKASVATLKKQFKGFQAAQEKARLARAEKAANAAEAPTEGPTDEELAAIEGE